MQSSAQRSSLQESQEARIDHPCVPVPKQFELELLISVPVQCCAVFPFTQFLKSVDSTFSTFSAVSTFSTSIRTSRSAPFGKSFKSQNQSCACVCVRAHPCASQVMKVKDVPSCCGWQSKTMSGGHSRSYPNASSAKMS